MLPNSEIAISLAYPGLRLYFNWIKSGKAPGEDQIAISEILKTINDLQKLKSDSNRPIDVLRNIMAILKANHTTDLNRMTPEQLSFLSREITEKILDVKVPKDIAKYIIGFLNINRITISQVVKSLMTQPIQDYPFIQVLLSLIEFIREYADEIDLVSLTDILNNYINNEPGFDDENGLLRDNIVMLNLLRQKLPGIKPRHDFGKG